MENSSKKISFNIISSKKFTFYLIRKLNKHIHNCVIFLISWINLFFLPSLVAEAACYVDQFGTRICSNLPVTLMGEEDIGKGPLVLMASFLYIQGDIETDIPLTIAPPRYVTPIHVAHEKILTWKGEISGLSTLGKVGAGTLKLAGPNSHKNGTIFQEGTLALAHSQALGKGMLTMNKGTLRAEASLAVNNPIHLDFEDMPLMPHPEKDVALPESDFTGSVVLDHTSPLYEKRIVQQETPTSCGQACAVMVLADRGVDIAQTILGGDLTSAKMLAAKLNAVDEGWVGKWVSVSAFQELVKRGSWIAGTSRGNLKAGHWVVVDGVEGQETVLIRDPDGAVEYKLNLADFMHAWTGDIVYKRNAKKIDALDRWDQVAFAAGGQNIHTQGYTLTLSGRIEGTGTLAKTGKGALILEGENTYSGGTILEEGSLMIGHSSALSTGPVLLKNGLLKINTDLTLKNILILEGHATDDLFAPSGKKGERLKSPDEVFPGNIAIDTQEYQLTLEGKVSGIGKLTKLGTGTLILNQANEYVSGTEVEAGTLLLRNMQALSLGSVKIKRDATLSGSGIVRNLENQGTLTLGVEVDAQFVVTGKYQGQEGQLILPLRLEDDRSPTAKLILQGPEASAEGKTHISVLNRMGEGGETEKGILIVETREGGKTMTGAFALQGVVQAGPYEYRLFRGLPEDEANLAVGRETSTSHNWYLRSLRRTSEMASLVQPENKADKPNTPEKGMGGNLPFKLSLPLSRAKQAQKRTDPIISSESDKEKTKEKDSPAPEDDSRTEIAAEKINLPLVSLASSEGERQEVSGAANDQKSKLTSEITALNSLDPEEEKEAELADRAREPHRETPAMPSRASPLSTPPALSSGPQAFLPIIRPELSVYTSVQPFAYHISYLILGTMEERRGEATFGEFLKKPHAGQRRSLKRVWGRILGQHLHNKYESLAEPEIKGNLGGIQIGFDLYRGRVGNKKHIREQHVGISLGHVNGTTKVWGLTHTDPSQLMAENRQRTGHLHLSTTGVGLYWTLVGYRGGYLEGLVQGNFYNGQARSIEEGSAKIRGYSVAVGLEFGYPFILPNAFFIEPQGQVSWQEITFNQTRDPLTRINFQPAYGWTTRAGLRFGRDWQIGATFWQPYVKVDVLYDLRGNAAVFYRDIGNLPVKYAGEKVALEGGLLGKIHQNFALYANIMYECPLITSSPVQHKGLKAAGGMAYQW